MSGFSVLSAATLPDPYPYYAELRRGPALVRAEELGGWVASSAAAVGAVLHSELCRVRPPGEPVPAALLGSPVAEVYAGLVRMQDGGSHDALKGRVQTEVGCLHARLADTAQHWAKVVLAAPTLGELTAQALPLSVYVTASLLGAQPVDLPWLAELIGDYAPCMTGAPTPEQLARGGEAVRGLLEYFGRAGEAAERAINHIGFLWQGYEATAGLLLNSLLALAGQPDAEPDALVREVALHNPSIQNTRRFVARDGELLGAKVRAAEPILLLLASANHDPNQTPENALTYSFGAGAHACPGAEIAIAIARAGVRACLAAGLKLEALPPQPSYRPSVNFRIPLL